METKISEIDKKLSKLLDRFKKMEEVTRDLNSNTVVLIEKIGNVCKDLEIVKKNLESREIEIQDSIKTTDFLLAENKSLKDNLTLLRNSSESMQFFLHNSEVEIVGIPDSVSFSVSNNIVPACKKWQLNVTASDIIEFERRNQRNKKGTFFHVKFINESVKQSFLGAFKKSASKLVDLNLSGSKNKIYINEYLSPYAKMLLYQAKAVKNDLNWRFAWSKNGKVFLREKEGANIIHIQSIDMLETLKANSSKPHQK